MLKNMVEVIGGVLWVYLPIFGIHEVPGILTMIGGVIVLFAIILDGVDTERVRQMIRVSYRILFRNGRETFVRRLGLSGV